MLNIIFWVAVAAVLVYFADKYLGLGIISAVKKQEEVAKNFLDVNKDGKINAADAKAAAEVVVAKAKKVTKKKTMKAAK